MAKKKSFSSISVSSFGMSPTAHKPVEVVCRILIVCEGEKTEPNYFKSFGRINRGGTVYEVDCEGGKINTVQVVNKAIEMSDAAIAAGRPYDSVWAVFDKDNFPDAHFNAAIQKAYANGIDCAWSNEAFELWYVFHFVNRNTPMSRSDYQKELSRHIGMHLKGYKYKKNAPDMRAVLLEFGDESEAIKFAERQAHSFDDERYASHNPATHVYRLVRLLRGEDKEFNRKVKSDINARLKK